MSSPPCFAVSFERIAGRRCGSALLVGLLLLVLSLNACGSAQRGLSRIQSAGMLRVAVDPSFPPFAYVDERGTLVGYDIDLARALAARWDVEAHFVATGYDALYDALTVGRADIIISALYPERSRMHAFAYSEAYFNAGEVLVVPASGGIADPADLAGQTLVCRFGTSGHMKAMEWEEALEPPPEVIAVEEPEAIRESLQDGNADAAVVDRVTALAISAEDETLQILLPPVTDEPYVIAVRREDQSLIEATNRALTELAEDGTLQSLERRWLSK